MIRLRLSLLFPVLMLSTMLSAQTPAIQLTFVGEQQIPTGTMFGDEEFGGISSMAYDAKHDIYYAISDDRSEHGPARAYTLSLDFDADSFDGVTIESVIEIQQEDGTLFPQQGIDAEGLAFVPSTNTLLWSSETDAEGLPSLREMTLEGEFVRTLTLPDAYIPDEGRGVLSNQAFEALTLSVDGTQIITAAESALMQDGSPATLEQGSITRILVFDLESGEVAAEYAYETGPIPHDATEGTSAPDNGLTELLPLDDDTLLSIERSFAQGVGNTIGIYSIDLTDATNIAGADSLADTPYTPVAKTHILTLEEGDFGLDLDNIEGAAFGPEIDGQQTLIFVSDNNFNPRFQPFTQFLLFTIDS